MPKHEEKRSPMADNRSDQENNKKSVNTSRRKALKTIAAGTAVAGGLALSGKWSKPVVDTIILPAHAQATNGAAPATTTPTPTTTSGVCVLVGGCIEVTTAQNPTTQQTYITSAAVVGAVLPPQAGIPVEVGFRAYSPTNQSQNRSYVFHLTTDTAGHVSGGKTFTLADNVTEIDAGYVSACGGSSDIGPCADPSQQ